jgi:hypothetical protein
MSDVGANRDVGEEACSAIAGLRENGLCEEANLIEAIMAELQRHKKEAEKQKRRAEAFKAAAEEIKRDALKYKRKAETFQTRALEVLQDKQQKLNTVLAMLTQDGVPLPAPEPAAQPHNTTLTATAMCSSSHHSTQRQSHPVSAASQGRQGPSVGGAHSVRQELGSGRIASSTILDVDVTVGMIMRQSVS